MVHTDVNAPETVQHISLYDLQEFPYKLALVCKECGRKKKYNVGHVVIDPPQFFEGRGVGFNADAVSFSAYFQCKCCGAEGPWEIPSKTLLSLALQIKVAIEEPEYAIVALGRSQLFDGTSWQTAAESITHLKSLIDDDPNDYFLWSRLGNVYGHADLEELAFEAYGEAVALNPKDIESHFNLGNYQFEQEDDELAAEHYHAVLEHAREPQRAQPEVIRGIVRSTLEQLFELHMESDQQIPFMPTHKPDLQESTDEPTVVYMFEADLSIEEGWEKLTDMCINELPGSRTLSKKRHSKQKLDSNSIPDLSQQQRTGRNDPCPCGSGRKHKKCCGRAS